ncbi:outer membrane protein assembly factor BamB family protein [Aquimarina algicola]|uniref:Pyrrolo-quinoline quinone repeat domain-containing protein n=1 Tax=Aquimarina algicola TaxID=2589995 RepID=A0A504JKM4_9FLAO|nr:PQQ-binding-like beta-propeller repeat protein [Aquimarina algicola]TPN88895.1 hypothetical protein FHK87_01380 [Aquimarina algicola]
MKKFSISFLIFSFLSILVSCSSDEGTDNPLETGNGGTIVSGNPELNTFVVSSDYEKLLTLDASTGELTTVYEFGKFNYVHNLPHYENDHLYFTTEDNSINAIQLSSKQLLWNTPFGEYDIEIFEKSITACEDGICYAAGHNGVFIAVDQATGLEIWRYSLNEDGSFDGRTSADSKPIIKGDKIYIVAEGSSIREIPASIHVVDKNSGIGLTKVNLLYPDTSSITFAGNILLIANKNLYAVNPDTFENIWSFEAEGMGHPVVSGNSIIVHTLPKDTNIESVLHSIDLTTGNIIWSIDTGFDTLYSPVIEGDVVFGIYEEGGNVAFSRNGRPFAVDLATGNQLWFRDDVSIRSSPTYANGMLYFFGHDINGPSESTDENSGLICMDANNGKVVWVSSTLAPFKSITPVVVAENGVFGPSYYTDQ